MEVYELYVQTQFSAAHSLRGYPGNCANMHGHNWAVEVLVRCTKLNDIGIGIDFRDIKQAVKDIVKELDHKILSDLPAFKSENPTSENISRIIYKELSKKLNFDSAKVSKVKVSETESAGSYYWEE